MSTDDTQATSAAREPSDAEVLAGAAALMKDDPAYEDGTYGIDDYLAMSRAVLLAARAALAKDQEQQEREARRQRFNVAAEAVERRKAEMTAAELKYRRATATPDHPLAEPDPEVERRAAVRALREAVADMRRAREGSWNLRDPRDPEVAYSVDVWLEVRANRLAAEGPCGDPSIAEPDHTDNRPRPHFLRGLSYPDPVDWTDEEEGEESR